MEMDPISVIVTALASGAAAALKPATERVITDAYNGIKAFIVGKYRGVEIATLEQQPASAARKALVKEGLEAAKADTDEELLSRAQALIDAILKHAPSAVEAAGLRIEDVEAESVFLRRILADGAVELTKLRLRKDLVLEDLNLGASASKQ
jgi:hypothetical protein